MPIIIQERQAEPEPVPQPAMAKARPRFTASTAVKWNPDNPKDFRTSISDKVGYENLTVAEVIDRGKNALTGEDVLAYTLSQNDNLIPKPSGGEGPLMVHQDYLIPAEEAA